MVSVLMAGAAPDRRLDLSRSAQYTPLPTRETIATVPAVEQ
jgi:hypothetical protein